jgi:hypothetical protein
LLRIIVADKEYCTVCKFDIIDKNGEVVTNRYEPGTIIEGGTLRCKTPKEPITIFTGVAPTEADKPDAKVQSALIQFAATGLLSLLVLAYLIEYLLTYVPALGAFLAGGMGAPYAPQLGGGSTGGNQRVSMDMPGGEVLNTMEDGFSRGFTKDMDKTSAYSLYQGTKEAMGDMVLGGRGGANAANDPGLITSFTNFLLNPHRDPYGH